MSIRKIVLALLLLLFPAAASLALDADFICAEYLARPTATSITINVIPQDEMELFVAYAPRGSASREKTETRKVAASESCDILLSGLTASTTYAYSLCWKKKGEDKFSSRAGTFTTQKKPGESFSFAIATDSHIYQKWYMAEYFEDEKQKAIGKTGVALMQSTLRNIKDAGVDFLITLGDEAQVHCYPKEIGPAKDLADAENRYRIMRNFYEEVSSSVPIFFACGNHEGEAGFVDDQKTHSPELAAICRKARMKFITNPQDGGEYENYFAWEWGDALFVVIDPFTYTTVYPLKPEQWTLGEKQLVWLEETLKNSQAAWKFIFCHQFVGGRPEYLSQGHIYGKGGVNVVQYGEQAKLHELMKKYGAQVYFYGNDHIYADGVREGIHYVTCGSSASPTWWKPKEVFFENYNYDFIVKAGFVKVDVSAPEVRSAFIETNFADEKNGRIAAAFTLQKDEEKFREAYSWRTDWKKGDEVEGK